MKTTYSNVYNVYKGLISLRKANPDAFGKNTSAVAGKAKTINAGKEVRTSGITKYTTGDFRIFFNATDDEVKIASSEMTGYTKVIDVTSGTPAESETIPTTNRIGNASPIKPANTSPIKNSGSSTMVHTTFDIPHAAFTAKPISFPNIRNIRMINSNVNMFSSPPRLQFFYHEILTYLQDQAFRCKLCVRASFQSKDTF